MHRHAGDNFYDAILGLSKFMAFYHFVCMSHDVGYLTDENSPRKFSTFRDKR